MLQLQYPDTFDLDTEDKQQFPPYICNVCSMKCKNWKSKFDQHKVKMSKRSVAAREPFETNFAKIGHDEITAGLVCSENHDCLVCSLVLSAD